MYSINTEAMRTAVDLILEWDTSAQVLENHCSTCADLEGCEGGVWTPS